MNGNPVSQEEIEQIRDMKHHGMTNQEIAKELNRSVRTVHRVSYHFLYPRAKVEPGVYYWLKKWWHWEVPKKSEPQEHSWFITPNNYPRMWKTEEGGIYEEFIRTERAVS